MRAWGARVLGSMTRAKEKLPSALEAETMLLALAMSSMVTPMLIVNGFRTEPSVGRASHGSWIPDVPSNL